MQNENIYEKSLGVVLLINNKIEQYSYFNLLEKIWYRSTFLKNVYEAYSKIKDQNLTIDILNVVEWLRENNKLGPKDTFKISTLSTSIGISDTINRVGIVNACYYNYAIREVFLMLQNVNNEITDTNPRQTYILKEVEKIYKLLSDNKTLKIESNLDYIDNVIKKHNDVKNGIPIGLELGWDTLKEKLILESDDVCIIGGRPAMGKTAWAISLIKNLCFKDNKTMLFFSLEMSKDRIIRRILSSLTNIDSNKIKYGHCDGYDLKKLEQAKALEGWNNIHIIDGSQNIKDIESYINVINGNNKLDLFVIDYLQKIIPQKTDSRYAEVTRISNDVKRIVMLQRIPCIALAQLNRDVARSGKRPSLPDLKESGEIEQDASIVGFLHRPEYYGDTIDGQGNSLEGLGEFIIAKNRDGEIGITDMQVNLKTSNWTDLYK